MPEPLFEAIPISYRGLFADQHMVDAQQFGRSLIGVSKLANSICHELFFEKITHDPRGYHIRFCVGPSKENGYLQEIFAVINSGQLPMFMPILIKTGKLLIEKTFDAVIKTATKQKSEAHVAIEAIRDVALANTEFASQVHKGQMRSEAFLQKMVEHLVRENRSPIRDIPTPVGRTGRDKPGHDERWVLAERTREVFGAAFWRNEPQISNSFNGIPPAQHPG